MKGTIIFLREKNKGLSLRRVPKCGNREKWVFSDQGDSVVSFRQKRPNVINYM